jgi:hypothetical protein
VTIEVGDLAVTNIYDINVYLFETNSGVYPGTGGGIGIENRTNSLALELPIAGLANFPPITSNTEPPIFRNSLSSNAYPQTWPDYLPFHSGCVADPAQTTADCVLKR